MKCSVCGKPISMGTSCYHQGEKPLSELSDEVLESKIEYLSGEVKRWVDASREGEKFLPLIFAEINIVKYEGRLRDVVAEQRHREIMIELSRKK